MNWKKLFALLIVAVALGLNPLSAAPQPGQGEWSVRLVLKAQTEALEDPYNVLGQLNDAAVGFDSHDLPELTQTFPGTYLSVIFYRPDWQQEKDTYNTDFHPVAPNTSDEWTFEVRSDDPARDLSLTWVGENTKMKNMVLVDLQEDTAIAAVVKGKPQVYTFRMNGTVREFAWRVLTDQEFKQFVAANKVDTPKAAKQQKSDWLPKGWGQGEGKGHQSELKPDGLPDDPFSN